MVAIEQKYSPGFLSLFEVDLHPDAGAYNAIPNGAVHTIKIAVLHKSDTERCVVRAIQCSVKWPIDEYQMLNDMIAVGSLTDREISKLKICTQ